MSLSGIRPIFRAKRLARPPIRLNIPCMEPFDPQSATRKRTRLLLLAEQALFRASLGRLLALEPDFHLVGECATGNEAMELVNGSGIDVVLLEYDEDAGHAIEFLSAAGRSGFLGKILIITALLDACNAARALKLGASGIFLKSDSADRLVSAIRTVANGQMWIDPQIVRQLADRYPEEERIDADGLTEREQKVLLGILGGLSNRKIGEDLKISESSVKAVVQQLFDKTGVRTRSQLVRIAISRSLHAVTPVTQARA